jgi:hypothetical protein
MAADFWLSVGSTTSEFMTTMWGTVEFLSYSLSVVNDNIFVIYILIFSYNYNAYYYYYYFMD